jgi:hypothetical protein
MSEIPASAQGVKRRSKKDDQIIGKIRIGSLNKLFAYRYGSCPSACDWQFPDDDAGLEDLKILLHHYRFTYPHRMQQIIKLRAPWADSDRVLEEIYTYPRKWKSERLGQLLNLTGKEWRQLRIRIAPVDMTKAERRYYSRLLSNGRRRQKRRAKGMRSRAQYLATNNLSQARPWEAEGISRRTWYRHRKSGGTSLAAIHKNAYAKPVPKVWPCDDGISEDGTSATSLPAAPDPCHAVVQHSSSGSSLHG